MGISLWDNIKEIEAEACRPQLMVMLDFDGTLSSIVQDPAAAVILPNARESLERLTSLSGVFVAVISGRALSDIKPRVGLSGIVYAGNHGLEIEGPGISLAVQVGAKELAAVLEAGSAVEVLCGRFPGLLIEKKGFGFSVHFRAVAPDRIIPLRDKVREILTPYLCAGSAKVIKGKMVLDVYPAVEVNKGTAVKCLLTRFFPAWPHSGLSAVYIGDDTTDEDAFRVLANKAVTVKVGFDQSSSASYWVRDEFEVVTLLEALVRVRREMSV